jgi:hypothetical protein
MGRTRASAKKETSKRKKAEGEEEEEKDEIEKKVKVDQEELNKAFLKACEEGSVGEVIKLLEEGRRCLLLTRRQGKTDCILLVGGKKRRKSWCGF